MYFSKAQRIVLSSSLAVFIAGCGSPNYAPSEMHMTIEEVKSTAPQSPESIPSLVKSSPTVPVFTNDKEAATFDVIVTSIPVRDLLFSLARDAGVNMDVDAKVGGLITMSALDQTLEAILARISEQIPIRIEHVGNAMIVKNDEPYHKRYHVDYTSVSRSYTSDASAGGIGDASSASVDNTSENNFWENLEDSIGAILEVELEAEESGSLAGEAASDNQLLADADEAEASFDTENSFDFNTDTGILLVYAPDRLQKEVEQYLNEAMSIARRQVLLEATVVEVALNNQYAQGVDWSAFNQFASKGLALYQGANIGAPAAFINQLIESISQSEDATFIDSNGDGRITIEDDTLPTTVATLANTAFGVADAALQDATAVEQIAQQNYDEAEAQYSRTLASRTQAQSDLDTANAALAAAENSRRLALEADSSADTSTFDAQITAQTNARDTATANYDTQNTLLTTRATDRDTAVTARSDARTALRDATSARGIASDRQAATQDESLAGQYSRYQRFVGGSDVGVPGDNLRDFSYTESVTDPVDASGLTPARSGRIQVTRDYTVDRVNEQATGLRGGGLIPNSSSVPGAAFTAAYRSDNISAAVELLDTFGDAKVLSSPRISVLNNQAALLRVVDQEVYFNIEVDESVNEDTGQVTSRSYTVEENTVDVGFSMNVLPHITNNDEVFLNLKPSVTRVLEYRRAPTPAGSGAVDNLVPITRIRELESVMSLRDGEIAVMGGLLEDRTGDSNTSVPGLSELPGVGTLFQKKNESTYKTEFVVFIKARIITNPSIHGDFSDYRNLLPDSEFIARDRTDTGFPAKQRKAR